MYGSVEDDSAIIPYSPLFALLQSCFSRSSGAFIFTDKVFAIFPPYLLPLM